MKRTLFVLAAMILIGTGALAGEVAKTGGSDEAAPAHRGEFWCGERIVRDLALDPTLRDRLDLGEDQLVRLKALYDRLTTNLAPLQARAKNACADLSAGWKDEN